MVLFLFSFQTGPIVLITVLVVLIRFTLHISILLFSFQGMKILWDETSKSFASVFSKVYSTRLTTTVCI